MTDQREPAALDADETEALRAIGWHRPAGAASCPDSSVLLALDEGVLDHATAARVRAHVDTCATCQLLMRDLTEVLAEDVDAAGSARIRARIAAGQTTGRRTPYIWWGAGLAAAAAVAWFLIVPRPAPQPIPATQLARATTQPIPSVFVIDRPSIPPGDVDLAVRGDAPTRVSLEDRLAAALDKADKNDVTGALTDLQRVGEENKNSRIAALALGAVQLRGDQNAEATATLERARALKGDAATTDETAWFLGIALVRAGQADRARTILQDICTHTGPRSASACAGVAEIDRNKSGR